MCQLGSVSVQIQNLDDKIVQNSQDIVPYSITCKFGGRDRHCYRLVLQLPQHDSQRHSLHVSNSSMH